MILVFYGFVLVGVVLLTLDVAGRLRASPRRVNALHLFGLVSAGLAALFPLVAWQTGFVRVSLPGPYPYIAAGYVGFFALFAVGTLAAERSRLISSLGRIGYAGLLALSAIPSFLLLLLSIPIGLAGVALTRSNVEVEGAAITGSPPG